MRARLVAVLVSVTLAVSATAGAIIVLDRGATDACHNQQALVDGLYTILDRSTERIPQYVKDGLITEEQAEQAYRDNRLAKADISRPTC